ncbi:hypothetical protein SG34_019000 [Thalassomonas viridans]|uniref:Uncharacterized protein n=1 Tax=Thalassomonas viridans TaxID=137584 RepID=A0AAE9YZW4_9GAMM|nr:hypothetical protein [Thalassomonas viridans]WDE03469.1 hypothetical protein SG34_019000 [Thalassomonas viridans]
MKIKLNKKKLKNLTKDQQVLPVAMTPQVGGADLLNTWTCRCHQSEGPYACFSVGTGDTCV